MNQLDAIDKGSTPPRDLDDIKFWEQCVDWRSTGPPKSACYESCYYDGCFQPDFSIPAFCDEQSGVCSHSVSDPMCEGVPDLGSYDGMEKTLVEGLGKQSFCFNVFILGPTRMAECPEPDLTSMKISSAASILFREKSFILVAMVMSAVFLFYS